MRAAGGILVGLALLLCGLAAWADPAALASGARQVSVDGKSFSVQVVQASLTRYHVKVGLAQGCVGATSSLAGIAQRYHAVAAINGCFFDAYTKNACKPPYHNLISGGQLLHTGSTGTTLGFNAAGQYRMARVRFTLQGGVDEQWKWPNNWYAYFLNHPCETSSAAILYTGAWAGGHTPEQGTQVVVQGGVVQAVGTGSHAIPPDGYVLLFAGGEQQLAGRFAAGKHVAYKRDITGTRDDFWATAQEALGCGPRLLADGQVQVDPAAEGFTEAKILSMRAQRSAVGITRDNTLLLVTCKAATIRELAGVMRALGAWDALNLDGGASASLWAHGAYLTKPGRDISNALLIVP